MIPEYHVFYKRKKDERNFCLISIEETIANSEVLAKQTVEEFEHKDSQSKSVKGA